MLVPNYFYAPNTIERKSTGLIVYKHVGNNNKDYKYLKLSKQTRDVMTVYCFDTRDNYLAPKAKAEVYLFHLGLIMAFSETTCFLS